MTDPRRRAAVIDRRYEYAQRSGVTPADILWSAEEPNVLRAVRPSGGGSTSLEVLRRDVTPFQQEPPYGFGYQELIRITLDRADATGDAHQRLLLASLERTIAPAEDGSLAGTELVSSYATTAARAEDSAMGRSRSRSAQATSKCRSSVRLTRQRTRPARMQLESADAEAADADAAAADADGEAAADADAAIRAASACLAAYDAEHRAVAAGKEARGFGGGLSANEWAASVDYAPLADAVRTLWKAVARTGSSYDGEPLSADDGRLILGICSEDALAGVAALKSWVTSLGLPKGPLHGMDRDGVPLDMSTFGAVYIKYNSLPPPAGAVTDPPGTARLSGYNGDFRGVYVNANLADGVFRQYAVLPLDLFSGAAPDLPEFTDLAPLGIAVTVREASAEQGRVVLGYAGPANMRRAVEFNLAAALRRADKRVAKVDFAAAQADDAES